MTADSVFGMALRTGNWGPQAYMLSFHAKVTVQLAPAERPDVLVRLLDGLPAVPRELTKDDVVTLTVRDPSGGARLALDLRRGLVERSPEPVTDGTWELRIEGTDQRSLHLYAQPGTRFPTDAELDALAATVEAPAR